MTEPQQDFNENVNEKKVLKSFFSSKIIDKSRKN